MRVPCLVLASPGTFSMIHTGGRFASMARRVSISGCARGSSRALRLPAVEKGWHGTSAHMHVARRMVFQCVMLAMGVAHYRALPVPLEVGGVDLCCLLVVVNCQDTLAP